MAKASDSGGVPSRHGALLERARRAESRGLLDEAAGLYRRAGAWADLAGLLTELDRDLEAGNTWLRVLRAVPSSGAGLSTAQLHAVRQAAGCYRRADLPLAAAGLMVAIGAPSEAATLLDRAGLKAEAALAREGAAFAGNPWPTGRLSSRPPPEARDDTESTNELVVPADPAPGRTEPGVLQARRAHVARALEALMSVAVDDPHYGDAADQVARMAWEHGLMSVRVAVFLDPLVRGGVELRPESADTLYTLGRLHERIGLHEKAVMAYLQALSLDPAHRASSIRSARLTNSALDPVEHIGDVFSHTVELSIDASMADPEELEDRVRTSTFEFNLGPLGPGAVVDGRFEIVAPLGEGGCGVVFRVRELGRDDDVALKVLRAGSSEHRAIKRFQREMEISAQLDHPNIVRTWDAGAWRSLHWIAMELLEGLDLGGLLRRIGRPLPPQPALMIIRQALDGLGYAHSTGVIHRDIKPSNIFVVRGTHAVKLLDFGLALAVDKSRFTKIGTTVGSPRYMAPERLRGAAETGPWTDLYSLGVVLYRMLTATMPFKHTELGPLLAEVVHVVPAPPSTFNPAIPPAVDAVVARLLAKTPEDRYAEAADVLRDLDEV